ncbi:acetolactate synthase-1/2/3 large subunit [Microbacterium ginsengiterrae]|uniref:Acetolactate synthase-1/2/3 large subunit n=1 Tax=Microbacterium ginsengiterrae TaxID=546115 RepID=A0A7W9FCT7_9MICO|nr:thiamine pyrophosphate-binding protein [Microbacterium ginsengiterrae]MBB5742574.1 acetolactate synthase-1/2/3 large subunit [Microbacterium ginsengiterrae]
MTDIGPVGHTHQHRVTVARAVMSLIAAYGVDTVFGIPGTHNIELYRPLQELGLRTVTTRHEQGAVFAADGWSSTRGIPGVVITTSGPGLLNALSAAGTAWAESRPLLLLSPGRERGLPIERSGALHETKDPLGATASVLSWSRRAESASEAIDAVHDAFRFFRCARPGPVHVELPLDLLTEAWSAALPQPRRIEAAPLPPHPEVHRASEILSAAARPAILAGGGSASAGSSLQTLAERLGAPVVTTVNGKGVISERHPLVVGSDIRLPAVQSLLSSADVLLVVGSDIGDAELWGGSITPEKIIRVDIDPAQTRRLLDPAVVLVGDAEVIIPLILQDSSLSDAARLSGTARECWTDVAALRDEVSQMTRRSHPELSRIVDEVATVLPVDAIIAGDSSQVTYLATSTLFRSVQAGQLLYMPTYATLGYGLPAALGAKIAAPERTVVGLIGDGALMFSVQEFVTAVEQRLCLPIVCVDNGGYGEIRDNMTDAGMTPVGVDLVQPDWAALGSALRGRGCVATPDSVGDAVRDALQHLLPTLIHVRVEHSG